MSDETPLVSLPPAASHAIKIDPALVEAVQDEPEILTRLTRGQLMLVQDRMVRKVMGDPDASATALAVVHERLSKNAKLDPENAAVGKGTGFTVVINLGEPARPAINVTPERVE